MRSKAIWLSLLLGTLIALAPLAGAQDPEQDDVRGAFLTSRPAAADKAAKPKPSPTPVRVIKKPRPERPNPPNIKPTPRPTPVAKLPAPNAQGRLGLGLTLFMRDSNGLAVRVDPNHEFKEGDHVRVLLETNADGHLYIFNTTDNGKPVMTYPNPQLADGDNFIHSHVPVEIPSSLETDERLRWFEFDKYPGMERLYFVFTREPLPGVPTGSELVKYCGQNKRACAWHPTAEVWNGLQKEMETPARADNSHKFGKAQTASEQEAVTRGIGLAKEDAEPTLVIMTASSSSAMLVTALEMLHK